MKKENNNTVVDSSGITPGEWEIRGNTIFVKGTYNKLATVSVQKNYEDRTFKPIQDVEMEANVRLMAASPDLLEALKEYIEMEREQHGNMPVFMRPITNKIKAAIEKATKKD